MARLKRSPTPGRAEDVFGSEAWLQQSQAVGHSRPAGRLAELEINAKPNSQGVIADALKRCFILLTDRKLRIHVPQH